MEIFIPHVWESPDDGTAWEDVWLLLEDGSNGGKRYWFTLKALSFVPDALEGEYEGADNGIRDFNLALLGDKQYLITPVLDMLASVEALQHARADRVDDALHKGSLRRP